MSWYGLSDAEYEIMQYIWDSKETKTLHEVMEYMESKNYTWKQQTLHTFLSRLIDKKVLQAEKKGNKRFYSPKLSQEEYVSQWTAGFLDKEYGGSLKKFLLAFTGGKSLSEEQAKELHDFLDK